MRVLGSVVVFVIVSITMLLFIGCGDDDPGCGTLGTQLNDVNIAFQGFDEHVGQSFKMRLLLHDSETDRQAIAQIPASNFNVRLRSFCGPARIDFYADVDGDNTYDPPPTDTHGASTTWT